MTTILWFFSTTSFITLFEIKCVGIVRGKSNPIQIICRYLKLRTRFGCIKNDIKRVNKCILKKKKKKMYRFTWSSVHFGVKYFCDRLRDENEMMKMSITIYDVNKYLCHNLVSEFYVRTVETDPRTSSDLPYFINSIKFIRIMIVKYY